MFPVVANLFERQDPKQTKQDRLKEWNDYTEVASMGVLNNSKRKQKEFTTAVLEEMDKFASRADPTIQGAGNGLNKSTLFINERSSLRVLLAIDEARPLLENPGPRFTNKMLFFQTFRRKIRAIPSDRGFFVILVDCATSHLANNSVFPSKKTDPGTRYGFVGNDWLFAPIYEIALFDAMVPSKPPQFWEELVSLQRLFQYGSPVFGAFYCDALEEKRYPGEIQMAIVELAYSQLLEPSKGIVTRAQAFASLGPTIQPHINPTLFHLNTELIASHAAHCDHITLDGDMVMSNYPSQFMLAVAAMKFLKDNNKLLQCIQALTTMVLLCGIQSHRRTC
ncbi:hypothetical protein PCASD_15396 [Puccinia coronata f. sp. avenae]|uniref:Uncharacterized protein n=1 Tax=Puccinia coronata f. sp. avenae TaxID=200324 RepID=A0A2N5TZ19_9BASI|nr:hypothetical protein PCASD_15396 [Puccinia coronata f. sp. avenae]